MTTCVTLAMPLTTRARVSAVRRSRAREVAVPVIAPRLSDHDRLDLLLDERERCMTDLAEACDVLWAFVQADGPDEQDRAYRRARAFLLLAP